LEIIFGIRDPRLAMVGEEQRIYLAQNRSQVFYNYLAEYKIHPLGSILYDHFNIFLYGEGCFLGNFFARDGGKSLYSTKRPPIQF